MGDGRHSSDVTDTSNVSSSTLTDRCNVVNGKASSKNHDKYAVQCFRSRQMEHSFSLETDHKSFDHCLVNKEQQADSGFYLTQCECDSLEQKENHSASVTDSASVLKSHASKNCVGDGQDCETVTSELASVQGVSPNDYETVNEKVIGRKASSRNREETETKFLNASFDCPGNSRKECALKPCPSLDSSLSNTSVQLSENTLRDFDNLPSSSPLLNPCSILSTPHSLPPPTPSTPASAIASQASLDSGVLSAYSFDLSQNSGLEVFDRRRTASSVSSGIGEVWQSSLDGEMAAMEAVLEAPKQARTSLTTSESVSVFSPTANPNCNDAAQGCAENRANAALSSVIVNGAQLSAHCQEDHSTVLTESCVESHVVSPSVIFPVASLENVPLLSNVDDKSDAVLFSVSTVSVSCRDTESKPRKMRKEKHGINPTKCSPEAQKKIDNFAMNLVMLIVNEAISQSVSMGWSIKCSRQCNLQLCREDYKKKSLVREAKAKEMDKALFSTLGLSSCSSSLCWTPELPFSPTHRSYSRSSKRSSLSFSHDSLVGGAPCQDDSHLIKGAVSHDTLSFPAEKTPKGKKGMCNICLDADIYSLPVDVVQPYQGPILHPKVIMQQPRRRYLNRSIKNGQEGQTRVATTSKRSSSNRRKSNKHSTNHRTRNNIQVNGECSTNKRVVTQSNSESSILNSKDKPSSIESPQSENSHDKELSVERCKSRHRKEIKCSEQGKLCRIIPFVNSKPHKRKEMTDAKDRKKGRSLSSNIRNTLVTFFSFKRTHKENGSFVNAKNEFIDASSQGFFESSDGVKWGKICPLPSAPPLITSVKYSAFTNHVSSISKNRVGKKESQPYTPTENKPSNQSHSNTNHHNHQRQSNSISPASLLSCLGHPRTNSIDEQEPWSRSRLPSEATKQGPLPVSSKAPVPVMNRALPPLPPSMKGRKGPEGDGDFEWKPHTHDKLDEGCDFASIIEKVKNYGWYWGPISGEAAEKVLSNEPDGSFIVRDSSDYHYIFSLTFRLSGVTSHVRIEHDQGNFSFGGITRFKSQTIVDFIEKSVEHSRSGRYLFFLHRRPALGPPMRVQLLHPVSRFKHVQSLQHLCRFVIVKQVRKDLIYDLPLPQRLKDYLNSPHYYSEQVEQCMSSSSAVSLEGAVASPATRCKKSPCVRHTPQNRHTTNFSSGPTSFRPPISSNSNSYRDHFERGRIPRSQRCNFNQPDSSYETNKLNRTRDLRLSSSHSSLENTVLQAYPISPSTLSSESNSCRPLSRSFNTKLTLRNKATAFFSGSSHSSPSSPVPFDCSPPDWISSAEELFQAQMSAVKVPPTAHLLCNNGHKRIAQSDDNFYRLSFGSGRSKTDSSAPDGGASASSTKTATDAFVFDSQRGSCVATIETLEQNDVSDASADVTKM